jgi:uncharacterized protein
MKIGILSDTHDRLDRTIDAVALLIAAGAEKLFHCGDFTQPDIVTVCGQRPCYVVFGNNDDDLPGIRRATRETNGLCLEWGGEVTMAGKRIAMTHGHFHKDVRRLLEAKPDYFLSGHSHIPDDHWEESVRRINPGALHRAEKYTVALLDLATDELQFLEVPR